MELNLTPDEMKLVKPIFDKCDALKYGFIQGVESVKSLVIQEILKQREVAKTAEEK